MICGQIQIISNNGNPETLNFCYKSVYGAKQKVESGRVRHFNDGFSFCTWLKLHDIRVKTIILYIQMFDIISINDMGTNMNNLK